MPDIALSVQISVKMAVSFVLQQKQYSGSGMGCVCYWSVSDESVYSLCSFLYFKARENVDGNNTAREMENCKKLVVVVC